MTDGIHPLDVSCLYSLSGIGVPWAECSRVRPFLMIDMKGINMASYVKENEVLVKYDILEIAEKELSAELEACFTDLSFLEEERNKIGNPDSMGQIVMDEVWKQFGNPNK